MSQPSFVSGTGYIGERTVTLKFDAPLDPAHPPPSFAAFQINGTNIPLASITVDSANQTVLLGFGTTLTAGDVVDFSYADPTPGDDLNAIQGTDGADAASFSRWIVVSTNRPNTAPTFVGSNLAIFAAQNGGSTSLSEILHVSDPDSGQTLTWSLSTAPSSGTIIFTAARATSGGADITPGGFITYQPTSGFAGIDTFAVQVSDGSATAIRTITVNVTPGQPGAPDLTAASDTGASSTDNVTHANLLGLTGTSAAGDSISTVRVILDRNGNGAFDAGDPTATATVNANGTWAVSGLDASGVNDGSYNVYASVTSATGGLTGITSPALAVQIDRTPPPAPSTPDMVSGSDTGASNSDNITSNTTPIFSGSAEVGASVILYDGVTVVGATTAADGTWSITPSAALADGAHTIYARATDAAGNVGAMSSGLAIQIDTTAPAISGNISVPANGLYGAGQTLSFTLNLSENVSISGTDSQLHLDVGGAFRDAAYGSKTANSITYVYAVQAGDSDANGIAIVGLTYTDGSISDVAGNQAVLTLAGHIPSLAGILVDTTAPAVSGNLAVPASGTYSVGQRLSFTVAFDENVVVTGTDSTLGLTIGSTARSAAFASQTANAITYEYVVQPGDLDADGISLGTISLGTTTIRDAAGNAASLSLAGHLPSTAGVLIDGVAPNAPSRPTLTAASDTGTVGDNVTSNTHPTFVGSAEAYASITLYDTDGVTVLGSTSADSGGAWSITASSSLGGGTHLVRATATDAAGNVSALSSGLTFVVDTTAPAAPSAPLLDAASDTGASDSDGFTDVTAPTFTGTAEAQSTVTLYDTDGTTVLGSAVAAANGGWSISSSTLALGSHTILAKATDLAGNVSASSAGSPVTIRVNTPATGAVSISGTAAAGQTLTAANTLADADGLGTVSYQWQRDGANIVGATGATYLLTPSDADRQVRVVASFVDLKGSAESVASAAATVSSGDVSTPISISSATAFTATPGSTVTLSGVLSGSAPLTIGGGGTVVLSGGGSYSGTASVSGATLSVNGAIPGATIVVGTGGTLGGIGTVGATSIGAGGALAAGNSPGVLHTANLTFAAGSTFKVEIASAASYDQADVAGTVSLGGATLNLTALGGFTPQSGHVYTIVANDGSDAVNGTFAGLAEGAALTLGGVSLTISYRGGDGNDVTLSAPPAPAPPVVVNPSTPSLIAAANQALGFDVASAKAYSPTVVTPFGQVVANPNYATALAVQLVQADYAAGRITPLQAKAQLVDLAMPTKGVAIEAYSFFTGGAPTAAGMVYLVNSETNATDLTDPYYATFNKVNRFINFAVNLGAQGEGKAAFTAAYGGLGFDQAVTKAYDAVIGLGAARAAGYDTAAAITYVGSQKSYFEALGGSDIGAKAAMVGYLLSVGTDAHIGGYYDIAKSLVGAQIELVGGVSAF